MARLKELAIKVAGDRFIMDLDSVHEMPGYNARDMESPETQEYIRRMADYIKANGIDAFPDITVFQENDKVYVHRGHCRLRAHKIAKAEGAEILGIRATAAPKQDIVERTFDLQDSNDSLHLKPLEKAGLVQRLFDLKVTPAEIARRWRISLTAVNDLATLLEAPEPVKEMVQSGEVSARMATDVVKKEGAQATETLKKAVQTAKEQGKDKATPKHLPHPVKKTPEAKQPEPQAAPVEPAKEPGAKKEQATPPQQPQQPVPSAKGPDWNLWGPRMQRFMERLRDVPDIKALQSLQMEAGPFLKNMEVSGRNGERAKK